MGRFNPVGNRKLRGKLDVFPGGGIGVLVQLIELERTNQLPMASDPMRVEGLRDRETNPCDLAIHDDVVHSIAGSSTRFLYLYSPGIHREFADRELEVTVPKSGEHWMSSRPSVQAAPGCMPRLSRLR
jgi:hypothetical protein